MIENVGYLDQTVNVITIGDLNYTNFKTVENSNPFKELSNNFFTYNKFEAVFAGFMVMKNVSVSRDDVICQLPIKPKYANPYAICRRSDGSEELDITTYVDKDGKWRWNSNQSFSDNEYIFVNCSFAIYQNSNGGG